MKVTKIEIKNFKCFEETNLDNLSEKFNLFIGDNGEGKTAILDALASALDSFISTFETESGLNNTTLHEDWVRRVTRQLGEETKVELQYPFSVKCYGMIVDKEISWERLIKTQGKNGKKNDVESARQLKLIRDKGNNVSLPLVAYYGNNRLWKRDDSKSNDKKAQNQDDRFIGYKNSLNAGRSITQLINWLSEQFQEEIKNNQPSPTLTVVKQAIADCLDEWNKLDYKPGESSEGVVAVSSTGQMLPLHLLSDGYRNILTIVADMAYRVALLNPHFGENAAKETSGIVLIDEIDLHLHPNWQERVIEDLSKTFPNIQFFATTHAPIIIQSLHKGKLIKIKAQIIDAHDEDEDDYEYIPTDAYRDQSPEDILEDVMDQEMPQRSKRYREMLEVSKEYYDTLEKAKKAKKGKHTETLNKLKDHLDELSVRYGDNPAYYGFLEYRRKVEKIDEE
ncbi:hypothetical protein NO976_02103 [Planktothrix agardhii]|jgi:predicted ATP-binding protein involved in virulence|uniref:AAA family ATPase n=1 Tax=Planktothrix agardhii TaxID=1160 RepID=UPI001D0B3D1C|nr:AAA family ATPase [Planktothrix agardhii]MCB8783276.1 AAA family ATPase [Planktothrix agardhii 1808]MCB8765219.1 AAA family ATPase [Planktothrix agardhii 1809]MCF3565700.1 AAA family ATPase [Planktothrix agardhii 1807]MCF3588880.1 AAA family ATPase [Planktothrix agardhii 1029]MCF3621655.1 AAA family ATPase [Planktothrix agardhii 1030]